MKTTRGFTTKRARHNECLHSIIRASAGRKILLGLTTNRAERQSDSHRICPRRVQGGKPGTRGFTLVETLVAIAVLTIAIIGPFSSVQRTLIASDSARDELIASSLAQEGIEYIRSVRDGNYLSSRSWLSGLGPCQPGPCKIDPTVGDPNTSLGTPIAACAVNTLCPLYSSNTYLYNQQVSGTVTPFTRRVQITTISDTEVQVQVTVSWTSRGVARTVVVSENLQNWL